jgi:hypothetical protein
MAPGNSQLSYTKPIKKSEEQGFEFSKFVKQYEIKRRDCKKLVASLHR